MEKINLAEKLGLFSDQWSPKIVGSLDDYDVRVVKIEGDFVWHEHAEADELFFVLDGSFRMDFRDRSVTVTAGEMIIVPRGTEHKPYADRECCLMLFERSGVVNTGDGVRSERTIADPERI